MVVQNDNATEPQVGGLLLQLGVPDAGASLASATAAALVAIVTLALSLQSLRVGRHLARSLPQVLMASPAPHTASMVLLKIRLTSRARCRSGCCPPRWWPASTGASMKWAQTSSSACPWRAPAPAPVRALVLTHPHRAHCAHSPRAPRSTRAAARRACCSCYA